MFRWAFLAAIVWTLLVSSHGFASITLVIGGQEIRSGKEGSDAAPVGSLLLLVAHVNDNTGGDSAFSPSFYAGTLNVGDFIDTASRTDGHDLIVERLALTGPTPGLFFDAPVLNLFGGWNPGDSVALYWIPSLSASSSSVGENVSFGRYTNDALDGGSAAWITPADGTLAAQPMFFSTINDAFGEVNAPAEAGYAAFVTVPEPGEYALLGIALVFGLMISRRQRGRLTIGQVSGG